MHEQRREEAETHQVGDFFHGEKRYYDRNFEITVVKIFSGDCYVTHRPDEMMVTVLGSCVAACVRDPLTGIAGINHFLLPGAPGSFSRTHEAGARYGAFAMEQLINKALALGASKDRLQVKVFGGANVIDNSAMIGGRNVEFVLDFLARENLAITASDLGGDEPRRIHFYAGTGRVMMRKLRRKGDRRIIEMERQYESQINSDTVDGDVELFV